MADRSYLDVLKRNVPDWNSWREQNPVIEPDLRGADLRDADLTGANLYRADLSGADLLMVNLSGATLYWAKLSEANLYGAKLSGATLSGADLSWAKLSVAKLSGADLSWAKLSGADLYWADLSGANLTWANLTGATLSGARLSEADLSDADLSAADLSGAKLSGAKLRLVNLSEAKLREANLYGADLTWANLTGATLSGADLTEAKLYGAHLTGADLSGANLSLSTLVKANLEGATLTGCRIYGISAWDLKGRIKEQKSLVISPLVMTPQEQPDITTDDLEVAQFIYLLLKNEKIRNVIETMTSKAVLILGNFSEERKAVLEEIRTQLRERNYLPILFDFEGTASLDFVETVTTLARLARFVIADITQPRAVPDELRAIVTGVSVPIQPFIMGSERPYATFPALRTGRTSVLKLRRYENTKALVESFKDEIVGPADAKFRELEMERLSALAGEA